jgi:hypothetical protein
LILGAIFSCNGVSPVWFFWDPTRSDGACRDCRHAAERRSKTIKSRGIGGGSARFAHLPLPSLQGDTGDDPIFPLPPHPGSRVELQMMVAKGNPKAMAGIDDLVRGDVRIFLPNPTFGTGRTPTVIPRSLRPKSHRMPTPGSGFVKDQVALLQSR